jgi:potassium channel subfamily K
MGGGTDWNIQKGSGVRYVSLLPVWSATDKQVVSVCVAGIISLALLVHFCFAFNNPSSSEPSSVRSSGRKFMLSVTAFLSIIALQALVFSRLEHWAYADGIYFSIQTALTIGYGDFTPSTAAGKVLVFPFAILTISQLGNEISLIVEFIRERSRERRKVWRDRYEGAIHREAEALKPRATLVEEMRLVHEINKREAW